MDNVLELKPWQTVDFPHFVGVRHVNGSWTHVILKGAEPVEIDLEKLGARVELHANGIEFKGDTQS
jgi:hypothetical protein